MTTPLSRFTSEAEPMRNSRRWFRERTDYSGTKWFVLSVLLVLGLAAIFSPLFWNELSGSGTENPDSISSTIRNVVLTVGAVLALPLAFWRGVVAENQVAATQRSVEAAHEAISNQRFQAAAQMLGHDLSAVRLGAVHTLAQLAHENRERYYIQTARLLASFVRQPRTGDQTDTTLITRGDGRRVREDVSAALDFIGTRSSEDVDFETKQEFSIDLHGNNFERWDLSGLNLARVRLNNASLSGATLKGTNLAGADLADCSLGGAFVGEAVMLNTRLSRANFTRWRIGDEGEYVEWTRMTRSPGQVVGLTQAQLDEALNDQYDPPKLRDVKAADTGELVAWHGIPPERL
ncbi:MAG: pentapeptide repeat-containing protein [Chloroflexi bacterium]|nr:pentapeptide repeat-containing protein [Chloroflexota bacterium]MCY3587136.1 pentapeptide repeat-containing protein [Chloroflexota bacterium]MCY3686326.1 pentapeptide repeat-containing protein [Chloroflexota bacterium]